MNEKISKLKTSLDLTRKGEERIAAIIEAGAEILLEDGFSSLTKRRIAKRVGMSHGNVGYYFPTRESLWHAVIEFELKKYYERHHTIGTKEPDDPQAEFDAFVVRWIDEYNDREMRIFFSHVIAHAEVNEFLATIRDEIYETFFNETLRRAKALKLDVEEQELERRVLEVMVVLEGLHAVSAFRPAVVERNYEFKQRLLKRANAIIRGQ